MQSERTNESSVFLAQIDLSPAVADGSGHSGDSAGRLGSDPASSALRSADCVVDRAFVLGFWCSFLNSFPLSRRCVLAKHHTKKSGQKHRCRNSVQRPLKKTPSRVQAGGSWKATDV